MGDRLMQLNLMKHFKLDKYQISLEHLFVNNGIPLDAFFKTLIISPIWSPFDFVSLRKFISKAYHDRIFVLQIAGNDITFIKTGMGVSVFNDLLLSALCVDKIKRAVFIGTAGAVNESINIGNVLLPTDAGLYSHFFDFIESDSLNEDNIIYHSSSKNEWERMIKAKKAIGIEDDCDNEKAVVFTVPSLLGEYRHLNQINALGFHAIDMEMAAFYGACKMCGVDATGLLLITDNSVTKHTIYHQQSLLQKQKVLEGKRMLINILCQFINNNK